MVLAILALVQEGRVTGVSLKQNQMHHGKSCLGAVRSLPDAFNLRAGLLGGIESWASSVGTSHPGRHGRQGQVNWGEGQEDDDDWERLPCPRLWAWYNLNQGNQQFLRWHSIHSSNSTTGFHKTVVLRHVICFDRDVSRCILLGLQDIRYSGLWS